MATAREIITGLYAGTFNRTPDKQGLDYWLNQASNSLIAGDPIEKVYQRIMDGFETNQVFKDTYDHLSDRAFVELVYVNALGQAGSTQEVDYWINIFLSNNSDRGDMVAKFIELTLNYDSTSPDHTTGLTTAEIDTANQRQEFLQNKVDTSLYFIDTLGAKTNIDLFNPLEPQAEYQASIAVLKDVTANPATKIVAIQLIDFANASTDPIDFILNPTSNNTFTANKINFDTSTAADSNESTIASTDDDIINATATQSTGASTVIDGLAGSDTLNITDATGSNIVNLANNATNIENIETINLATGISQVNLLPEDILGNAGGEISVLAGIVSTPQTLQIQGETDVVLTGMTLTNIEKINLIDSSGATTGRSLEVSIANLTNVDAIVIDTTNSGGADTLQLKGAGAFDFSAINLDFNDDNESNTLAFSDDFATSAIIIDDTDIDNVGEITGASGSGKTNLLSITGATEDGDLSGMTITDVDTVIIGGTKRTLTLDDDDLSATQYTTITGAGDSLLVFEDNAASKNIDLTNTNITGFSSINVDNSNNGDNLILDATSLVGAVTLTGGSQTDIRFTEDFDASNITLTTGSFDDINLDEGVDLIVDNDIFPASGFENINGNGGTITPTLTVNMSSNTLDLKTYLIGDTSAVKTIINDTDNNDTITAANTKHSTSEMTINLSSGGSDVVRLNAQSGNLTGSTTNEDALSITSFNTSDDQINVETALISTNSVVSRTSGNVDQSTDGIIVITGATMNDFSNITQVATAVGSYANGATADQMVFAISNITGTETAIYSFKEDGTVANTVDATDEITLIGIVEHTGTFDITDISAF
ncbi:MAG: DUF4214 domain-containing protein [Cocleimonas sp.]|nr:DUF4214 domain-containing protein [Cocleimonas sp.]